MKKETAIVSSAVGTVLTVFAAVVGYHTMVPPDASRRETNRQLLAQQGYTLTDHRYTLGAGNFSEDCYSSVKSKDDGHVYETCVDTSANAVRFPEPHDLGIRIEVALKR